ncbi:hypothetical protein K461DRAFT_330072 [Myriangium duriaei CBS 260.36]|uniref:Uncharacterized protein n=1 Tax=Myriangium duriaei CBS 260.36 TaxID=1168546 RepID=A0A9P4IUH0_9PEZI|nr:hypothetical protein K461DRAFT_330072 [Myriangium duriaei CBS 260.36]
MSLSEFYEEYISRIRDKTLSPLLPYDGLILTVTCVIIFACRFYVFEPFTRRCYGQKYTSLNEVQRRSLINHHVAGTVKLTLIVVGAYPFIVIMSGVKALHSPVSRGSLVTVGDVLLVMVQIFTGMYIFELFYRALVSPISAAHHVGAIIIAQSATVLGLSRVNGSDAIVEFLLCLVWGAFDVVAEIWPHLAMIIYRVRPTDYKNLMRIFLASVALELIGTLVETVIVMNIFGSVWGRWPISFKVVTPILHTLFSLAQLWGARVLYSMYRQQKKLAQQASPEMSNTAEHCS